MRRIRFDFSTQPLPLRRSVIPRILAGSLTLVLLAFVVSGLIVYLERERLIDNAGARLTASDDAKPGPGAGGAPTGVMASDVARRNAPWMSYLAFAESAHTADIALRSLQPNPMEGVMHLHGYARDMTSMWAYVERWRRPPISARVRLVRHEAMQDSAQEAKDMTVSFRLDLSWEVSP